MGDETVGVVRVTKRVLVLGHQAYPLDNICRVQTLWYEKTRTIASRSEALVLLGVLVFLFLVVRPVTNSGVASFLAAVVVLGAVGIAIWRANHRPRSYVLMIESAGAQRTVLEGPDEVAVADLRDRIVASIEEPPQVPVSIDARRFHFGDNVGRDKYEQNGAGGSLFSSGGRS